jgi:UDP-N-acetylglucosamine--N-acetylmuramyl-(pentapeptide) pyrophosphoryl-undecaprenol N-acetylglucosamine transferase
MKQSLRIIISGGGTGGHIFPAIAIADALKKLHTDADIMFVGAQNRMEMNRVPLAGYPIRGLWISGFQRKFSLQNVLFPLKVIVSYLRARQIVKNFKPDCVIGVGGYASGPTLRAAISLGYKTLIQEQNSFPGVTNRILAGKVDRICVAYEKMDKWFPVSKTVLTGNPLRQSAVLIEGKRTEALNFFGLTADKKVLLIVGGSQGARAINLGISANLGKYKDSGVQLIWQTGEGFYKEATEKVTASNSGNEIKIHAFIQRMDLAYAAADCIISRAGAIAISEMAVIGKPVIFVPLPTAAEDHQTQNALRLVKNEAALLVKNSDTGDILFSKVTTLMADTEEMEKLSKNIKSFALPDADKMIANEIVKLIAS